MKWIERYEELRRTLNMPDAIAKLVEEVKSASPAAVEGVEDMTVEDFYSGFNLDFMTEEERQTIYTATELYAKGKVRMRDKQLSDGVELLAYTKWVWSNWTQVSGFWVRNEDPRDKRTNETLVQEYLLFLSQQKA